MKPEKIFKTISLFGAFGAFLISVYLLNIPAVMGWFIASLYAFLDYFEIKN